MERPKIKKYIDCVVPIRACTLRCHYCYIPKQNAEFLNELPKFDYTPEYIAKALSKERLGGCCVVNFCGRGETLLCPEMTDIIKYVAQEGHFVTIVTNGTITKRFDEIIQFPKELLSHIFFKFSFHYLELKRLNLLDTYFENIKKVRKAGCSISVELGASDEYIPYIDEIKKVTIENLGAIPHIVVLRDDSKPGIPILTELSKEDYHKTWEQFDSDMFRFQTSVYNKPRKEFCYGGLWTAILDLGTGNIRKCYSSPVVQNIYKNLNEPIKFAPIGHHCPEPHCYNAHMFMIFGLIPEQISYNYMNIRNRVCEDGSEWLTDTIKDIFVQNFSENNHNYSKLEKIKSEMILFLKKIFKL